MTVTPNLSPELARALDEHAVQRATDADRWAREHMDVQPPCWAVEVDGWGDHGSDGDNLLRACQTMQHTIDDGVYVYGLGMQRPDSTLDDLQFFIHPNNDGITLAQARALAAALIALADAVEGAK